MENASRALIMAGGMLIAILVLGIGARLIFAGGEFSQSYYEGRDEIEIVTANQKFLNFAKDMNAQDMVTLLNLAKENNTKYSGLEYRQVNIYINGAKCNLNVSEQRKVEIMKEEVANATSDFTYKYSYAEYNEEGYVKALRFTGKNI